MRAEAVKFAQGWLVIMFLLALIFPWLAGPLGIDFQALDRACIGACAPSITHLMGTDSYGRDALAQLLLGSRTALLGGLAAAVLSGSVGFMLGAVAAWHSRAGQRLDWISLLVFIAATSGIVFYGLYAETSLGYQIVIVLLAGMLLVLCANTRNHFAGQFGLRADRLLFFLIEVVSSIPGLLLLLALAAMAFRAGLWQLVLVYVSVRWTRFAVLSLQEVRNVLQKPYVEAAHFAGIGPWPLMWKHILPNSLPPIAVELLRTVAGFVLLEGTFSFLGLGLPITEPSWGRLLAQARLVREGWWLWTFPGLALLLTIFSLQLISNELLKKWRGSARSA